MSGSEGSVTPACGFVYVIGSPGSSVVKIGRSVDVTARLAAIQPMSPVRLEVLWSHRGDHVLEAWLHRRFAEWRSHGEWFDFGDKDPVACVREAVESPEWETFERTHPIRDRPHRLPRGTDPDSLCAGCGHKARNHRGSSAGVGAPEGYCVILYGDSDIGCSCPTWQSPS